MSWIPRSLSSGWELLLAVFAYKKWYSEALFLGSNLVLTGLLVLLQRISTRTETKYSSSSRGKRGFFPWVVIHWRLPLVLGSLIIIIGQHVNIKQPAIAFKGLLVLGIVTICGFPRLCRGPLSIRRSWQVWFLGLAVLQFEYPMYDRLRFQWRFTGKQK